MQRGAPISTHNFISLNNISTILRYLYEKHLYTQAVAYHEQSNYCRFVIGHSLGRMAQ